VVFDEIEALSAPIFSVWRGRGFWAVGGVVIQISRRRVSGLSLTYPVQRRKQRTIFSGQKGTEEAEGHRLATGAQRVRITCFCLVSLCYDGALRKNHPSRKWQT
jgi:hypothetical protein